jgi:hypothetical protein
MAIHVPGVLGPAAFAVVTIVTPFLVDETATGTRATSRSWSCLIATATLATTASEVDQGGEDTVLRLCPHLDFTLLESVVDVWERVTLSLSTL